MSRHMKTIRNAIPKMVKRGFNRKRILKALNKK